MRSRAARLGLVTFLVVAAALVLHSLWWFRHPAPCSPGQTHCDEEFVSAPTFRELTLGIDLVLAGLAGAFTWALGAVVTRLSRR